MVQDFPEPPAYSQPVITNTERAYSIRLPDASERRAGWDAARTEAALLHRLDALTGGEQAADAGSQQADMLSNDVIAVANDRFHPATRVALIVGGSALLWAAIAYGVVSIL